MHYLQIANNWVEMTEEMMRRARERTRNQVGGMKAIGKPIEDGDSNNDDGTEVQLSDESVFGFDFDGEDDEV